MIQRHRRAGCLLAAQAGQRHDVVTLVMNRCGAGDGACLHALGLNADGPIGGRFTLKSLALEVRLYPATP